MHRTRLPALAAIAMILAACSDVPAATIPPATVTVEPSEPTPSPTASTPPSPTPSEAPTTSASPEPKPEPLAWARLEVDGPTAREDHTWTLDPAGEVAYLFGGRDGATVFDDTWAFDLEQQTWTKLTPSGAPAARFGHEAVWADGIGLVIFSGQAGPSFFNDLWAYDPAANTWTELPAEGALPTPRYGSCAGIGPDDRLWISHGFTQDGNRFSDTRAYDFATGAWTDETPDGTRPVERCLHGCWWTDAGELALYAGQTTGVTALDDRWVLRNGAWERVEGTLPPARNLYARARHEAATLVFGGQAVDSSFQNDVWLLDDVAANAQALEPAGEAPPGRAGAELIVDAGASRAILFGGRAADGALNDTWILNGL
ncbi:MAG: Kelch repeat-containing protein [Candidatus Limnocylindria bacterium]